MHKKQIYVDFDIHLIQQLRLIQAIAESAFSVSIPPAQLYKFDYLRKSFSFNLSADNKEDSKILSEIITIDHKRPITCIGEICKPLIFPHEICFHCRSIWKDSREIKFSFIGLVTKERRHILKKWRNEKNGDEGIKSIMPGLYILNEKIKLRMGKMAHRKFGELYVFSSRRGREYPTKAWDGKYFRILANSQFVLCPRGKSDWTYRFFEAILCGAIPVVEKDCEVYQGFKYYQMHEPIKNFNWSIDIAAHNYQLCLERITIPLPVLNEKLESLFKNY